MKRTALLVAVLCVFTSGCDDSKNPLSDPQTSKADERLVGVWRLLGKDQVTYYHVGQAGETLANGVLRAVAVTHSKGRVGSPGELMMFPTVLGDRTYLNVTAVKEQQVKLSEEKGWKAVDSYLIFKYQVDGEKLLVWVIDGDARKRAIEEKKVKGVVEENKSKFTDTTENLARFVAEAGDGLFSREPLRLERVEMAGKR